MESSQEIRSEVSDIDTLISTSSEGSVLEFFENTEDISARDGIHVNGTEVQALFDTGCKPLSIISQNLVHQLSLMTTPIRKLLSTAKKGTKVEVIGFVSVKLKYKLVIADVRLYVVQSISDQVIISLHDILRYFLEDFYQLLLSQKQILFNEINQVEYIYPWESEEYDEAPELLELYDDDKYDQFCSFRNMTHDQYRQQYFSKIDTNVEQQFLKESRIKDILHSELALSVFCNQEWTGIEIEPFKLNLLPGVPTQMKPVARKVNPAIYAVAKAEFERLQGYFYNPSTSPIAVPLVIAKKATKPFVRFCGDYPAINKYIEKDNYPIPSIRDELFKILGFKYFLDVDLTNAFHQIRLHPETSRLLSIVSPWGQFEPKFLPEGVNAGSQKLHRTVRDIFVNSENEAYTIQIHDNILILCHDYEDACLKFESFLNTAAKFKVALKFEKSFLGFTTVNFFGYVCSHNEYHLSDERKQSIQSIPFPDHELPSKNIKAMQSILGCGVYFKPFVPNYSIIAQPLYNSIKKDFNWKDSELLKQLKIDFDIFKSAINDAQMLHYPDYSLEWFLQTDASIAGLGGVLLQKSSNGDLLPITFISKAHSVQAQQWATIQQEAHAIYFCVKELAYMLSGKDFVIETDHSNLKWMELSQNPHIIRMYLFLRSFSFLIKHIPGSKNKMADFLSRMEQEINCIGDLLVLDEYAVELLDKVHNIVEGHHGVRNTWIKLNKNFPGHTISTSDISEFIDQCGACQKNRRKPYGNQLKPIHRPLPKDHLRYIIGIDFLTVTPTSNNGNTGLYVVRNLTTKHTDLYPAKTHSAECAACAIYDYITSYGLVEAIISDPGSDFTSRVVKIVNSYLGLKHHLSIIDRHESNGVERTNAEILKHLHDYVHDSRLINNWDNSVTISTVRYFLNYLVSTETGISPFEATFGTVAYSYQKLFEVPTDFPKNNALLTMLNDSILVASEVLSKHIEAIDLKRSKNNVAQVYQKGDYVMFKLSNKKSKLQPIYSGPYRVLSHINNEVKVQHPCKSVPQVFHMQNLYLFFGTTNQAVEAALRDDDQYFVDSIIDYRGNSEHRSKMSFLVRYMDESEHWIPYSPDINQTEAFERFCSQYPELSILLKPFNQQASYLRRLNLSLISPDACNKSAYLNLRAWGHEYYDQYNLPPVLHLVPCNLGMLVKKQGSMVIEYEVPLFKEGLRYLDSKAYSYYVYLSLPSFDYVIIDKNFCIEKEWDCTSL